MHLRIALCWCRPEKQAMRDWHGVGLGLACNHLCFSLLRHYEISAYTWSIITTVRLSNFFIRAVAICLYVQIVSTRANGCNEKTSYTGGLYLGLVHWSTRLMQVHFLAYTRPWAGPFLYFWSCYVKGSRTISLIEIFESLNWISCSGFRPRFCSLF